MVKKYCISLAAFLLAAGLLISGCTNRNWSVRCGGCCSKGCYCCDDPEPYSDKVCAPWQYEK